MPFITNEKYRAFLKGGMIELVPRDTFIEKLNGARFGKEGMLPQFRSYCILLWMTAARPNEVLRLQAKDITKKDSFLVIRLKGSKGGYEGEIRLPLKDKLVEEVWNFSKDKFDDFYLFWMLKSKSIMKGVNRVSMKKGPDGTLIRNVKHYDKNYSHETNKIYGYLKKTFDLPPYYFRHNRMSVAAEKLTLTELMLLKRSKTESSVRPYLHLTEKSGKRISKELTK